MSFNWFMLHDFSNLGSNLDCGFKTLPNGVMLCSLGLLQETGSPKPASSVTHTTAWDNFVADAVQVTPPDHDPVRSCPAGGTSTAPPADAPPHLGPPYPIVLAHGFFGYQDFAGTDYATYFYKVRDYLAAHGEPNVFTPSVDPFGSSEHRGDQLALRIQEILAQTGYAKVNLIGHSQGGFDARVVAHDHPELVASVVTVATPHVGSPVADVALQLTPDPNFHGVLDEVVHLIGGPLSDLQGQATSFADAMQAASTTGAKAFNAKYPDAPGVSYFSMAGRSNLSFGLLQCQALNRPKFITDWDWTIDTVNPMLAASGALLVLDGGDNDGFVPVDSAKWGTFLGCLPSDHLDEIGQVFGAAPGVGNTWNYAQSYADLVAFLRSKGF